MSAPFCLHLLPSNYPQSATRTPLLRLCAFPPTTALLDHPFYLLQCKPQHEPNTQSLGHPQPHHQTRRAFLQYLSFHLTAENPHRTASPQVNSPPAHLTMPPPTVPPMAGTTRQTSSTASTSLLNRQRARIADTLFKASRRRDEEVRRVREREQVAVEEVGVRGGALAAFVADEVDGRACKRGLEGRVEGVGVGSRRDVGRDEEESGVSEGTAVERATERKEEVVETGIRDIGLAFEDSSEDSNGKEGAASTLSLSSNVFEDEMRKLDETFERLIAETRVCEAGEERQEKDGQATAMKHLKRVNETAEILIEGNSQNGAYSVPETAKVVRQTNGSDTPGKWTSFIHENNFADVLRPYIHPICHQKLTFQCL